jgi:hypothetical protein
MATEELEKHIRFSTERHVIKIKYVPKEKSKLILFRQKITQTATSFNMNSETFGSMQCNRVFIIPLEKEVHSVITMFIHQVFLMAH